MPQPPRSVGAPSAEGIRTFALSPVLLRRVISGRSQPLPSVIQGKVEQALGVDFSDVRIRIGPEPAALGANAFSTGSTIYFAPGRFQPQTLEGQRLIARELVHIHQQRTGRLAPPRDGTCRIVHDPVLESEADQIAALILQPSLTRALVTIRRSASIPLILSHGCTIAGASVVQRMEDSGMRDRLVVSAESPLDESVQPISLIVDDEKAAAEEQPATNPPGHQYARFDQNPLFPIEMEDWLMFVNQGSLGDCHFLAGVAALVITRPRYLEAMILERRTEDGRVFEVKFKNGKILVDDQLPVSSGALKFASKEVTPNSNHAIFAAILEKAAACRLGSYNALIGGQPADTLKLLASSTKSFIPGKYSKREDWQQHLALLCSKRYPAVLLMDTNYVRFIKGIRESSRQGSHVVAINRIEKRSERFVVTIFDQGKRPGDPRRNLEIGENDLVNSLFKGTFPLEFPEGTEEETRYVLQGTVYLVI
ncbi:MAG TPA: DUF4157 domain-containing protein [Kofleriaceae bacterium]